VRGRDGTGEPFLGAGGSGTLPARAGSDGTAALSSASGLRTGATAETCARRRRRAERRRQRGDDDGARWHGSPGAAWTGSSDMQRSDSVVGVARSDTGGALDTGAGQNGAPLWRGHDGSAAPGSQSGRGAWRLSR
jgi:hypothetical protein